MAYWDGLHKMILLILKEDQIPTIPNLCTMTGVFSAAIWIIDIL